tara:strand:+ start:258 stop:536 length:279 start_codon:yes stop_codon:yes gene_type:complete
MYSLKNKNMKYTTDQQNVFVRDVTGRSYVYSNTITVNELMRQLSRNIGIPVRKQSLVYAGRHLSNYNYYDKRLVDLGVRPNTTISVTIKMIG